MNMKHAHEPGDEATAEGEALHVHASKLRRVTYAHYTAKWGSPENNETVHHTHTISLIKQYPVMLQLKQTHLYALEVLPALPGGWTWWVGILLY